MATKYLKSETYAATIIFLVACSTLVTIFSYDINTSNPEAPTFVLSKYNCNLTKAQVVDDVDVQYSYSCIMLNHISLRLNTTSNIPFCDKIGCNVILTQTCSDSMTLTNEAETCYDSGYECTSPILKTVTIITVFLMPYLLIWLCDRYHHSILEHQKSELPT